MTLKILYIGGAGRSGSTLLEMILGNCSGFFSVGEILEFWHITENKSSYCGCGQILEDCEFWQKVTNRLSQRGSIPGGRLNELKLKYDRTRNLAMLPLAHIYTEASFTELRTYTERLYRAVQELTDGRTLVDSSKTPSHLYLLSQIADFELHVLHLVRDPRAVAFSWNKRVKQNQFKSNLGQRSLISSILRWSVENSFIRKFGQRQESYTVLRYEDFVRNPFASVTGALRNLNFDSSNLSFLDSSGIELHPTHSIGGNPIRFQRGSFQIHYEDSWEKKMARGLTCALGLIVPFQLLQYHYPLLPKH